MNTKDKEKQIHSRLCKILLSIAEGQRKVEKVRKELNMNEDFDIPMIFRTVAGKDNSKVITSKSIRNYLQKKGLKIGALETELLVFFYDQDHDGSFTFAESFNLFEYGESNTPATKHLYLKKATIPPELDELVFKLLTQEIILNREIVRLLNELNHVPDFNVHFIFHLLKDNCGAITARSLFNYLKKFKVTVEEEDIELIMTRLDIDKDKIIDFCEFHAFIGFPQCGYTCPCKPCPFCSAKYCQSCLKTPDGKDISCYLLGCNHLSMSSLMPCTSLNHNPTGEQGGAGRIFRRKMLSEKISKTMVEKERAGQKPSRKKGRRANNYEEIIRERKERYYSQGGQPGEGEYFDEEELQNMVSDGQGGFSSKIGVGVLNNGKGYKIMDERRDNDHDYFIDYSSAADTPIPYPEYLKFQFTDSIYVRSIPRRNFVPNKCHNSNIPFPPDGMCPICAPNVNGSSPENNNNNASLGNDDCIFCVKSNNDINKNCPSCRHNIHCPPRKSELEEEERKNGKECPEHSKITHNCISPPSNVGQDFKNYEGYEYAYNYITEKYEKLKYDYEDNK